MLWWYWMIFGLLLLVLELATPGGFYLIFFGCSALIVGAAGGLGLVSPDWIQWLLFSVIAVVSLLLFRGRLLAMMKTVGPRGDIDSLVGQQAVALQPIAAGGTGKVELHGSSWNACNAGSVVVAKDQRCRVDRVDGLTLWITPS